MATPSEPTQAHSTDSAATARGRAGRNKKPVVLGVLLGGGVALALAAYWAYDVVATPPVPKVETASLKEVIGFMTNSRGMLRLSRFEQERFLTAWKKHYGDDQRQRELKKYLEQAPEEDRAAIRAALFKVSKQQFLADAQHYLKIKSDPSEAYKFLVERITRFAAESAWLKGNGDPTKDLSSVMGSGGPRSPEDWTQLIVSETTPEERLIGEQYLNAIKQVREQERRKQPKPNP